MKDEIGYNGTILDVGIKCKLRAHHGVQSPTLLYVGFGQVSEPSRVCKVEEIVPTSWLTVRL